MTSSSHGRRYRSPFTPIQAEIDTCTVKMAAGDAGAACGLVLDGGVQHDGADAEDVNQDKPSEPVVFKKMRYLLCTRLISFTDHAAQFDGSAFA